MRTTLTRRDEIGQTRKAAVNDSRSTLVRVMLTVVVFACAWMLALSTHAAAPVQRIFATAEDAAAALANAVKAGDRSAIIAVLGPGSEQWVWSGDAVADRAAGEHFIQAYAQKHAIEPAGDKRATLTLGPDDWPFAFPLVETVKGWRFATEQGKTEVLARRIGENELAAINVMLAIVDAQHDYAAADHNRDGVREYAKKLASSPGQQDGLYWPTAAGETPSPLGALVSRASREGYQKSAGPVPYHGYLFRMLQGQGASAHGGALDYVVEGHMIGGFAVVAYPAKYGVSGIMSFIVNHEGVVYQKDLGRQTATSATAMTRFDPGLGWDPVPSH